MSGDRDAVEEQLLDGGEILTCTFATMGMLQRAVAAELGEDDGFDYGLAPKPDLALVRSDRSGETENDAPG